MKFVKNTLLFWILFYTMVANLARGQLLSQECDVITDPLMECLDFVVDTSTPAPSVPCCASVYNIQNEHPECICELLQALQNPLAVAALGLPNLGVDRALQVPPMCLVAIDFGKCPALLDSGSAHAPSPAPVSSPSESPALTPAFASEPAPSPMEEGYFYNW